MAPMRTRLPPNVTREKNRHGTVVYYYRLGKGARRRLPEFGSAEFEAAYQAALAGEPVGPRVGLAQVRQGTLGWAVLEYKKSLHFRGLDPITQRRRDSFFKQMVDKYGDRPLAKFTEQTLVDARERRTGGKGHAANNFLKAVKPMFAYARSRGWIDTDPARNVDYVRPKKGSRRAWTMDDVVKFEQRHPLGTMANLAMRILLFTGFRRADAAIFGRQHVRNGVVRFRPGKTEKSSGVVVTFTALPPLLQAIEATETGDLAFLVTERGLPFASSASFGNWFEDRCKEAEVDGRAHGLRKLGPSLAAQAGASAKELMAMWGWTTLAQAELYTRSADAEILGESASAKLMTGWLAQVQKQNNIPRTLDAGAGIDEKSE
jgi:site-specific recombinase XerD